jgi:phage tail sheath gpL-like
MAQFNIPGVYSEVDASAAVSSVSSNDSVIGIIATASTGVDNKPIAPTSYDDAVAKFGSESNLVKLMKVAMQNGGNKFILVKAGVDSTSGNTLYQEALDALELEEAVNIVLIDSTNSTDHTLIKTHCKNASDNRRERISFVGYAAGVDISTVNQNAANLNSGRMYIGFPNLLDVNGTEQSGIFTAAAIAGAVAAEFDPSMPLTGVELNGFFGLAKKLKDSEMESLISAGVIPLEVRSGSIRIVRAVSTYTKSDSGAADITWQELTTTRISDYIFKDLRNRLSVKFSRAKQNQKARDAVKSEVLTGLKTYEILEYIENVTNNDVSIQINPTNPTRSDVVFKYDVVAPMNVIHLTGHLVI